MTIEPDLPPVTGRLVAREVLGLARLVMSRPRAAFERAIRLLGVLRARIVLRRCEAGALVVALGDVNVTGEGSIRIGDRVQFAGGMFATSLHAASGGSITIDALCFLSYGVSISAVQRVQIGKRCQIASMVLIRDQNELTTAPVTIGDDVWLAYGVIVEPGVTIGEQSVVSAGSVVRSDIPPYSLAQGNPAIWAPLRPRVLPSDT